MRGTLETWSWGWGSTRSHLQSSAWRADHYWKILEGSDQTYSSSPANPFKNEKKANPFSLMWSCKLGNNNDRRSHTEDQIYSQRFCNTLCSELLESISNFISIFKFLLLPWISYRSNFHINWLKYWCQTLVQFVVNSLSNRLISCIFESAT